MTDLIPLSKAINKHESVVKSRIGPAKNSTLAGSYKSHVQHKHKKNMIGRFYAAGGQTVDY